MRKFIVLAAFLAVTSSCAFTQEHPTVELYGGYQFTHVDPNLNANGWNASFAGNVNSWFGVKTDFSGAYKSGLKIHSFLFGPVATLRKSETFQPFMHGLVGVTRLSDGGSTTGFSLAVGGGLDVKVHDHIAWRMVQADWNPFRVSNVWVKKNARISTGIVFRF